MLQVEKDKRDVNSFFIDFRLQLMKGWLRIPFEDKAKDSSFYKVLYKRSNCFHKVCL